MDDIKLAGKKQNIDPMYTWDVLKDNVKIRKDIVDNYRTMFESRISAGATEKLPCSEIFEFLRGPTMWKVMPRNVWSDVVNWRTRRHNNSTMYQLHALTTTISNKKN